MFDTHCHLNFSRFRKNVDEVIQRAHESGVTQIVIPGTDIESSKKAVEIAGKYEGIYAAVGIHPHHAYEYISRHPDPDLASGEGSIQSNHIDSSATPQNDILKLEELINLPKVVAVGEIGLDKHIYKETRYEKYTITPEFFNQQKQLLTEQLQLAVKHNKSIIIHNREAADDLLELLNTNWDKRFEGRTVFHCCEPKEKLLEFAKSNNIFIGIDGDITYTKEKQEFIKEIPPDLLVVETDSPFLLPEPMRSRKEFPNEPKNIPLIISFIASLLHKQAEEISEQTEKNAKKLFSIS